MYLEEGRVKENAEGVQPKEDYSHNKGYKSYREKMIKSFHFEF